MGVWIHLVVFFSAFFTRETTFATSFLLSINYTLEDVIPASILHKSISDRYRSDRVPVGPITVRYRFKQNAR